MISPLPTPVPVDVSNWPAPSPQWPTLVLSGASLVVALAALVVAVATLRFTKQAWEKEGAVLDINFVFFYWGHEEAPLRDHAEYRYTIKNIGRTMTEILSVSIDLVMADGSSEPLSITRGEQFIGHETKLGAGHAVQRQLDPKKLPSKISKTRANQVVDLVLEVRHTFGVERQSVPDYAISGLREYISRDAER